MSKKQVLQVRDLPYCAGFGNFFDANAKVTAKINKAILDNRAISRAGYGTIDYDSYLGEENAQVYSPDKLISCCSDFGNSNGKNNHSIISVMNAKDGTFCQLLLEATGQPNGFFASYFISEYITENSAKCIKITRGHEVFDGQRHTLIENSSVTRKGNILSASSYLEQDGGEHSVLEDIAVSGRFWARNIDKDEQYDFRAFRQQLIASHNDHFCCIDGELQPVEGNEIIENILNENLPEILEEDAPVQ